MLKSLPPSVIATAIATVIATAIATGQAPQPSFDDVSATARISASTAEPYLSFGDYDSDGDPDLLVDGRKLFRNDSTGSTCRFTEVTAAVGIAKARGPSGCWFDFDLDGWLDFGTSSGEVWINDGKGSFRDFSKPLAIAIPRGSSSAIAWGDIDGDGWLDMVSGGNTKYDPLEHFAQSCWRNTRRTKPLSKLKRKRDLRRLEAMQDVSARVGIEQPMYGRSMVFCDYDWDGDDDLYSGNYHLKANFLFRNDGGVFHEVAAEIGVTGVYDQTMFKMPGSDKKLGYRYGHTIGATWVDINNDGYFDLWVSNLVHKYAGGGSFGGSGKIDIRGYICDDSNLFLNQGPPAFRFVDGRPDSGIKIKPSGGQKVFRGDELWSNAVCGDLDNDGWVDTFVNQIYRDLSYSHGLLFMNRAGKYEECHVAAGIKIWGGYGSAFADIDSDGRLDVVVCGADQAKGKPAIHVFRNTTPAQDWIGFDLLEAKGVQTVGAKVLLIQHDGVQIRQHTTTMGSHGQQNDGRIHFGLGSGGALREVFVYWPDGRIQSLGQPKPGRYHRVRRRGSRPKKLRLVAPARARAGQELSLRAVVSGKGWRFDWDLGGSRWPERSTEAGQIQHTFAQPGKTTVWVRAIHPRLGCAETRTTIDISAR